MTLYRLAGREQKLKQLMQSFPQKENRGKKRIYLIDSSFKHKEISKCGVIERSIFSQTVNDLIEKEREVMRCEQKEEEAVEFQAVEKKLSRYVKKKQHNKLLTFQAGTDARKVVVAAQKSMKKVYIERKYNTKLAYQMQSIMQAKNIEDSRSKLIQEMNKSQESPLINNVLKVTTDRKTIGSGICTPNNHTFIINNTSTESRLDQVSRLMSTCKKNLHSEQLQGALQARDRQYISPLKKDPSNKLKKYDSNIYLVSLKPSPKKRK